MKDIKKWWKSLREKRREKRQMAHKKEGGREKRLEDSRRMPSPERLSLRCRLVRKLPGKHKRSSKGKEPLLGSERRSPGSGVGSTKPASEAGNSKPVNEAGNPEQVNEAGGEGPILPEIEGYGALNEFLHSLEPEPNRLRDFLLIDKLYKLLTWNTPIDINTLLGILRYRSSPAALVQAERQGTTRADAFRWTVPQGPVRMRAVHGNSVERLKLIKAMILAALEMSNPGNVHNSVSEQSEAAQDLQDLQDVPAYSSARNIPGATAMSTNNGPTESRIPAGEEALVRSNAEGIARESPSIPSAIPPSTVDNDPEAETTQESALIFPPGFPSRNGGQFIRTNPAYAWTPPAPHPGVLGPVTATAQLVRATNRLILPAKVPSLNGDQAGETNPDRARTPPPPPRRAPALRILPANFPSLNGRAEGSNPARTWRPRPPPPRAPGPRYTTEVIVGATNVLTEDINRGGLSREGDFPRTPSPFPDSP